MKLVDLEGKVYQGTPIQIVSKMRNVYNRFQNKPVTTNEEFMQAYVEKFKFLGDRIIYKGTAIEERCASFIQSLLETGQAKEVAS